MTTPRARRWGAGTSAIVRALIAASDPLTQGELAALVGVSQPRVSQVLSRLAESSAVVTRAAGYAGRKARLVDLYVANHRPALLAAEAPWYGIAPLAEQVEALAAHARAVPARVAVSADLAPDLLVPWRHPTLAVIYTDTALNLGATGFVRAEGRVDATVLVRHTADTTLLAAFEPWPRVARGLNLADPVQQIWDLFDLGGEDRHEGARRLRSAVLANEIALPA